MGIVWAQVQMSSDFRQMRNNQVVGLVDFSDADVEENQEKGKKEKKNNLMEKKTEGSLTGRDLQEHLGILESKI